MTLNMSGQIAADDITGIKKLDPARPVYLLVGDSGKVVVKNEITNLAHDPRNMRYAMRNMKAVDPTMATKQLTSSELDAIAQWAELKRVEAELFQKPLDGDINTLSQSLVIPNTAWVKTNFFEGLINLESAAAQLKATGDKSGVRAIAAALTAPGGLEKLGQIMAVDCFNGNDDRFDFSQMPNCAPYNRLTNTGNVAVCLQDNILRPVGMDAWSGSSASRYLDQPPSREWTGVRLKDDQRAWRAQVAAEAAADIEAVLGPRNRRNPFGSPDRLPKNAGQRIAAGMDQGIATLKTKLLNMYAPNQRPPGLQARIIALGWAIQTRAGVQPAPPMGLPPRR